jgi:hypothetical protein
MPLLGSVAAGHRTIRFLFFVVRCSLFLLFFDFNFSEIGICYFRWYCPLLLLLSIISRRWAGFGCIEFSIFVPVVVLLHCRCCTTMTKVDRLNQFHKISKMVKCERERDDLGVDVVIWVLQYSTWQCDVHCGCLLEVYNMFALISYYVSTGGLCSISDRSLISVFYNYCYGYNWLNSYYELNYS